MHITTGPGRNRRADATAGEPGVASDAPGGEGFVR